MRNLLFGALAAAAGFLQAPAAQPPPTGPVVLAGRVITSTGQDVRAVRHARVTLSGGSLRVPRVTDTDTEGGYRFEHLPAGTYHVSVQKPGFVKVDDAAPDAVLTMLRAGAIEGIVADATGDPVANVAVSALWQRPSGAPKVAAQTRTDDLGRYRLYGLDAGEYVIQAATDRAFLINMSLTPGQKMPDTTTAFYPFATSIENAKAVHVNLGREASGVDVTLTPNPPIADPTGRPPRPAEEQKGTARISGRITDATSGKPIRGARLLLLPTDGIRITNWTSTDARGRFEYTNLAARKYTLQASAELHITLEYGRTRPNEAGVAIDVAEGQDVADDMSLPRAAAIEGLLTDEFGDPAAGVTVQLGRKAYAAGRQRLALDLGGRYQPQPSDDRGHYRVFGVDPGEYLVGASDVDTTDQYAIGGLVPTYYPGTLDAAGATPVTVSFGADTLGVSFTVLLPRAYTVTGTMVGPAGTPVGGLGTLWLLTPDSPKRIELNMARTATDPSGQFVIHNIPSGQYVLQGFGPPPAGYTGPMNLAAMPFGWTLLAVGDADVDGVILKVTDGTKLRGRVIMEEDSGPPLTPQQIHVSTAPVEFDSAFPGGGPPPFEIHDDWTFEVSHQTGRRRILAAVASPLWMVKKITHNKIDITDEVVDFREKDVEDVEVTLTSKTTRVTGAVSDDKGLVTDYAVVIFSSDPTKWIDRSRFVVMARGVQQGRFDVRALPPDDYLAVALTNVSGTEWMDPEFLQAIRPLATSFILQEGESRTLELKLKNRP
jgi:hypothetical protein